MEKLIIKANSRPQLQFLEGCIYNDVTLYGGAAGPGKTWSGVIIPIYHTAFLQEPNFRMQIFRTTEDELNDNIVPECHRYYPHAGGVYNEAKMEWIFSSGARVRLCHMHLPRSWQRYGGGNNTVQVFDEMTKFHPDNFTVETWNRSACGIKPFRVYLTNPGGASHNRGKKIVDVCPALKDGGLRYSELAKVWYQPVKASPPVLVDVNVDGIRKKVKLQYIPARVFDNEDLLKNNPQYVANLLSLPPDVRRMHLDGDWNLIVGQMFSEFRSDIHLIKFSELELQPDWGYIGAIDYGNTTAFYVLAMDRRGNIFVIGELTHIDAARGVKARDTMKYIEYFIESDLSRVGIKKINELDVVGDTDMFTRLREIPTMESAAKSYEENGINLRMVSKASPARTTFKKWQVDIMKNLLHWKRDVNGLYVTRPKIYFCADRCPKIIETLPALQRDALNPDIVDEKEPKIDHWFRVVIYGIINLMKPASKDARKKEEERIDSKIRRTAI